MGIFKDKKKLRLSLLYVLTLVLAACSLLYELLIAQTLSLLAANTVVWYSVTVGIFLLFLGLGAILYDRFLSDWNPWRLLCATELGLTIFGASIVILIRIAHMVFSYLNLYGLVLSSLVVFFGCAFVVTAIVGLLTGIELPLLMNVAALSNDSRKINNRILGVDYIGSLLGGLSFPLLFVPNFALFKVGFVIASLNLVCAGIVFLVYVRDKNRFVTGLIACFVMLGFIGFGYLNSKRIQQYFLRKYYYYMESSDSLKSLFRTMHSYPKVKHLASPYQKIDLVRDGGGSIDDLLIDAYSTKFIEQPGFPRNYFLFLNGDFQFTSNYEEVYHEYFAHVPMMVSGKVPKHVLLLGGGDGILLRELVKYKSIESITHIDLDRELIQFARTNEILTYINDRSFEDPRVTTDFSDGFYFLRHTSKQFDAIYIDFPVAVDYNLSKLYSREFYHFVKQRLKPDGYAIFDSVGLGSLTYPNEQGRQYLSPDNDWFSYYHTLRKAGFNKLIPFITTLEVDNAAALRILRSTGDSILPWSKFFGMLDLENHAEELDVARNLLIRGIITDHAFSLQQGFIIMANDELKPSIKFNKLEDVKLHVLNKKRFELAFQQSFPMPEKIDETLVNSISKPTLPNLPIWYARLPF